MVGNTLYLAWIGTNSANNLYIAPVNPCRQPNGTISIGTPNEIYDYSHVGPALVDFLGRLYVAFTGTNGYVYIGYYTGSHNLQNHTRTPFTSNNGVGLSLLPNSNPTTLVLAYEGTNAKIYTDETSDGVGFFSNGPTGDTAIGGVALAYTPIGGATGSWTVWDAFIGTDAAHSVNGVPEFD